MQTKRVQDLSLADLLSLAAREKKGEVLVEAFGTLNNLDRADVDELREAGLSQGAARRVLAALELARRYVAEPPPQNRINCPADVARLLAPELRLRDREIFRIVLLDRKNHVVGCPVISVGTQSATLVHPSLLMKRAIVRGASALILVHSHPSGDPTPSPEDVALTKRIKAAGDLLGIDVLDHVVVGAGERYVSLRESGAL